MVVQLELLVVAGSPSEVIRGDPSREDIKGAIDIGMRTVSLTRGEQKVALLLEPDCPREKEYEEGTDREDITSDSSAVPSSSSEDEME